MKMILWNYGGSYKRQYWPRSCYIINFPFSRTVNYGKCPAKERPSSDLGKIMAILNADRYSILGKLWRKTQPHHLTLRGRHQIYAVIGRTIDKTFTKLHL